MSKYEQQADLDQVSGADEERREQHCPTPSHPKEPMSVEPSDDDWDSHTRTAYESAYGRERTGQPHVCAMVKAMRLDWARNLWCCYWCGNREVRRSVLGLLTGYGWRR